MESFLNVPGRKLIWTVDDSFLKNLNYRTYLLIRKSVRYRDDVAKEVHRMTSKTAVLIKNRTVSGAHFLSIFHFLQDL